MDKLFKSRSKHSENKNACSNCLNRFNCDTMAEIEGSVCPEHETDHDALTCDDCKKRDYCDGYGCGDATCEEFDLDYKETCDDCANRDECKVYIEGGDICNRYEEERFVLTPKGIWYISCVETLAKSNGHYSHDLDELSAYDRFFEKYEHGMYTNGLIDDSGKPKLIRGIAILARRIKNALTGRKTKTSVDVLFETASDKEFDGTVFSDNDTVMEIYGRFVEGMEKCGYLN